MESLRRLTTRDKIAALSLANLVLLEVWRKLIYVEKFYIPYWSWRDLLSVTLLVSIFTFLFAITIRDSKRSRYRHLALHRLLYLLPILLITNFLRRHELVHLRVDFGDTRLILVGIALTLLLLAAFVRWFKYVLLAAEFAVLGMVGFVPLTFGQALGATLLTPHAYQLAALLPPRPAPAPRVVWIIFDEMDWRYTFGPRRTAAEKMPVFDRLRKESFYGVTVHQAGLNTIMGMPSLITGRTVYSIDAVGYDHLMLHFRIDPAKGSDDWKQQETVFSRARAQGVNVGVVGWYLPYCRIFNDVLSKCMWESTDTVVRGAEPSLRTSFVSELRTLSPAEKRQRHIVRYSDMMSRAKVFVNDPELGLVLLHMPLPHGPLMYNRHRAEITAFRLSDNWYLDNLALTDRAMGEIRETMEEAGTWDKTTVLVSSDHALRPYSNINESMDSRVPFLLKMAGQKTGFVYDAPFHALLTHDLILAILKDQLSDPQQVADWIKVHERIGAAVTPPDRLKNPVGSGANEE